VPRPASASCSTLIEPIHQAHLTDSGYRCLFPGPETAEQHLRRPGPETLFPFSEGQGAWPATGRRWATSDEGYFYATSAAAHTRISASAACTPGGGVTATRTCAGAGRRHCSQHTPRPSAPGARMRRRSPCRLLGAVAASAWLATLAAAAPGCGDHGLVARVWTQPAQATGAADANTLSSTQVRRPKAESTWRGRPVLCQAGSRPLLDGLCRRCLQSAGLTGRHTGRRLDGRAA